MKFKKVLAFAMAASLFVSTPVMATGTTLDTQDVTDVETTETVEEEATEELSAREEASLDEDGKKYVEETTTTEAVEGDAWNGVVPEQETEAVETVEDTEVRLNELENVELDTTESVEEKTGVAAPEDAVVLENKEEVQPADISDVDEADLTEAGTYSIEEIDRDTIDVDLTKEAEVEDEVQEFLNEETVSDEDMVRVIIVMDGDSILDKNSDATANWLTKIQTTIMELKQNSVVSRIERKVLDGEELDIRYNYTWLLNGVATEVPYGMIDEIEAISGVEDVVLQPVYEVCESTVDPYTVADGVMIGREDSWAAGYTGKGIVISIIDTGLDDDHQNFAALSDDKLTEDSATKATVSSVLSQLNASKLYEGLTVDDVYRSTKVAFGFNYVDESLRINHSGDSEGDHGTHVAGIAAANDLGNGEAVGVAPDAQLYVMKVFGANGGAYSDDLLAAVEDSLILNADVINMSLGSPAGFTSDGDYFDEIYGKVSETNTILAIAAGNSTTMGYGNFWGTDTNLTSNPDNSVVSSPATYVNATSVASVENVGNKGYYVEVAGSKLAYIDGSGYNEAMITLAGQEYDYAMVDNCGQSLEDFTNADVEGKIAVVQRGVTAFSDKQQLAQDAGAVACLVYNNVAGTISMDLSQGTATIPCASITLKDGEYLAYAKEQNADAKMYVSNDKAILESDTAYQMSDFSSWGVAPDLKLEPDVTAPGGNIYSTLDGGEYGLMSGTSMASPNMAGVSALVMQYAKANYPDMSASELHTFVNTLIVSTAEPLAYDDTLDYSPRNQGAGLVNAYSAIKTSAYLTVDGVDVPKAELGDDPAKTGSYAFTFDVTNFGNSTLYYELETSSQTEGVLYDEYTGKNFMSTTPVALAANTSESSDNLIYTYDYNGNGKANTADARRLFLKVLFGDAANTEDAFRYDLNANESIDLRDVQAYLDALVGKNVENVDLSEQVLEVPAGKTVAVNVAVNVTNDGKSYMDTNFENGIYVEGFTTLTAKNSGVDLSLPYMGFYGDWTQAPILDSGYYWQDDDEAEVNQYYNILWSTYGSYDWLPGINPYIDEAFDINNISFSPNGDGYVDYIADIYVSLLRNAKTLSFTYTDATTGEVYLNEVIENVPKSYYVSAYGMALPYIYSWYSPEYKLTDTEGNTLPNNTKLNLSIKATLDYDAHESNNVSDEWVTPITVDTEAPVVTAAKAYRDETTGKYYMELTVSDNVKVAAVNFLNKSATNVLAQYPVDTVEQGAECTMTYDITGFGEELVVILGDYACNERAYVLEAEGNEPEVDESLLYGYRVYDANYSDDTLYGWIGIDAASADVKVCSSEYYVDYALTAATYVGGMIVAVDANNDLVAIKPGYWDERSKIASLGTTINQLVFDATTETLYGYNKANNALVTIDIATGELTRVTDENSYFSGIVTMACDDEGNLYGVNSSGVLKTINKTTGTWGDELLNTYSVTNSYPSYAQSMTYDAETDSLYWARFSSSYYTGYTGVLYKIDLANNYAMTAVGTIAGNAEVVGLLKLDSGDYELPENAKVESISLDQSSVSVLVGGSETVNVVKTPWYAESEDYVWSSTDEKIAVVSDGKIVGKDVGTTTIKVTTEDGKLTASCEVTVVNPQSDLTAFVMSGDTLYNQWISFSADATSDYETLSEDDFLSFYAGEYVDGYIYAYSSATELYKIDASTLDAETISKTKISTARSDCYVADMAYDYRTGYMYALVQDLANDYSLRLAYVDVLTGDIETISDSLVNEYENTMISLAVATDGTIYMLSVDGLLYTYDVTARTLTKIGYTGYSASSMSQCLAYDHDTDELYWTMLSYSGASLMYIDTTTGKALPLGSIDGMAQVVCMYTEPDAAKLPERAEVAVESVTAKTTSISLIEGATVAIPVSVKPYNATDRNITWTSADETVAVVANGMLTGKGEGTTTITGKLANFTVTINVEVIESAGAVTGYILSDLSDGSGMFWGDFKDSDLSNGNGLADASEYYLYAGEYYDGKVYGYGPNADTYDYSFIVYDRDDLTVEKSVVCKSAPDVVEMAFDYSTGVMYAVAGIKNTETNTTLYMVDTETGDLYKVADLSQRIMTLACTEAGVMYGISVDGALYQINKTTGELTMIGDTGYGANMYQSMAYDYNTGNMYWAQTYYDPGTWLTTAYLFVVDVTDASVVNLGQVGTAGCQISALHIMPQKEMTVSAPTVTGVLLNKASELLQVGETTTLSAKTAPLSVAQASGTITYTSDNTSVATVDANGVITAVAAGTANITAAYGTVSATCVINVVGTETQLYAVNTSGWEKSPLLQPGTIASTVSLPEDAGLTIARACYCQDGYFYAIDTDGYLWKYTEDLTVCEKIGTQTVVAQLSNTDDFETDTAIVDMAANGTDVYVMASGVSGWMNIYYIYKLDLTTGAATIVKEVSETVPRPVAFTFISASEVVIYDGYTDYIYKSDITDSSADEEQLAFVQFTVASGDHISMTYSSSLKQVFIATDDYYYNNGMALFKFDPATAAISKISDAAYNANLASIFMVEGTTPLTGTVATAEEEIAESMDQLAAVNSVFTSDATETTDAEETTEPTEAVVEEPTEVPEEVTEASEEVTEKVTENATETPEENEEIEEPTEGVEDAE